MIEKKIIKIKLSEKSVEELLDLQERLGLAQPLTRGARKRLLSREVEALFG